MKILKRAGALLLSAALLVTVLSGCGQSKEDPIQEAFGFSKKTVFATLDGEKITAEDYLFWLARNVDYIDNMYKMMGNQGINWDEELEDGMKPKEYLKNETLETVKSFWVIRKLAKEEGVKLGAEDKKAYEEERAKAVEGTGGEETYLAYLKSMCLTEEGMKRISEVSAMSLKLEEALCGEGKRFDGAKDTIRTYMEEQGILKAKHILLLTKDPAVDGKAYSADKIAQQKTKADDLLAQLRAAEDPVTLFDTLMKENSEDTGLESNPDGYLFSTNPDGVDFTSRMVPQFEEGTKALTYNAVSDVIESDYGYHIILRLDPLEDEETLVKYQEKWYGIQMDNLYQEKLDAIEVKTTEAYDNFDVKDFYEKLIKYRETVQAALPKDEEDGQNGGDNGTTPPEGDGTTPPEGDGATPPEGDGTTTPEGDGATPPEGDGTTTPEGDGTTPPEGDGTTTPEGGTNPDEATPPAQ